MENFSLNVETVSIMQKKLNLRNSEFWRLEAEWVLRVTTNELFLVLLRFRMSFYGYHEDPGLE